MPITTLPPLHKGHLHSDLSRDERAAILAHCNLPHPMDLAELRQAHTVALRKISSATRKHGEPGYRPGWEANAHPTVIAARQVADAAHRRLLDAQAVEQAKLTWAILMGSKGKHGYKTFRQCLEADLVAKLPETHTSATWTISAPLVASPVAAREAFYDLPMNSLFMLSGFSGNSAPPPAAIVRITEEAVTEARSGWDPAASARFKATPEHAKLRRKHSALLKTRFFKRLVEAYAYDEETFEELAATEVYTEACRGANASQTNAFAKKASAATEIILLRSAIRYLGPDDAAHLFNRIAHAAATDRPSVLEFYRLLEDYNGDSFFPGVPEFDLKPAK